MSKVRVLYHSTHRSALADIMRRGLVPSSFHGDRPIRSGVYLAISPFWACMYGGEVLLEVTVPDNALLRRPRWADEHERLYYGVIGPRFLKVFRKTCGEVLAEV